MKVDRSKIRLLVIEDNKILREGIISLLKRHKDIKIIAESGNDEKSILKIHELKPTVILLDLGLRSRNSLVIVETVKKEFPDSKLIVMDLVPVLSDILRFINAGASGFILKNTTPEDFLTTIRAVAEGEEVVPPHLKDSLFSRIIEYAIRSGKTKLIEYVKMTKREKEILNMIGDGASNNIIAQKMHVSEYSVKSHVKNILEKLTLRTHMEPLKFLQGMGIFKSFSENISTINN